MNYELAKKLKDVGFPVKDCYNECCEDHPTLSELIDACGKFFRALNKDTDGGQTCWVASGRVTPSTKYYEEGKTPSIAVANLYIALQEAKHPLHETLS